MTYDINVLRDKLSVAALDNSEVTLTPEEALVVWRLMGPLNRGFEVGDRVTWGVGASSYKISKFDGVWAYMNSDTGIFIETGEKPDSQVFHINNKALISELRKA